MSRTSKPKAPYHEQFVNLFLAAVKGEDGPGVQKMFGISASAFYTYRDGTWSEVGERSREKMIAAMKRRRFLPESWTWGDAIPGMIFPTMEALLHFLSSDRYMQSVDVATRVRIGDHLVEDGFYSEQQRQDFNVWRRQTLKAAAQVDESKGAPTR